MKKILNIKTVFALLGILLAIIAFYGFGMPEGVVAAGGAFLPYQGLERNRKIIARLNQGIVTTEGKGIPLTTQDSYLRFDQALANNSTVYKFDFRQTVNNTNIPATPTARLLAQGDAFFATFFQIMVGIVDTSLNYSVQKNGWITYDNQNIFSVANLPGTTVGDLETLYDTGILTFHMGNTDFIDQGIPLSKNKVVPITAGNGTTTQDSVNNQTDGCVDLPTICGMSGNQENWWLVNTQNKSGIAWQSTSGTAKVYVSMRVYGVLVKGGSNDTVYPKLLDVISGIQS